MRYQILRCFHKAQQSELKKPTRTRVGSFLVPPLDIEQRDLIRSCVAVRIGVSCVTWSRLEIPAREHNSPCQLTHWQHHEICEKKLHINDLVQRCLYVERMIPIADCYVFENPQMAQVATNSGSAEQQNISIQKAQISAIFSYALAKRNYYEEDTINDEKALKNQVYYLRRFLAARLFKHLVGTERVSSENTVLKMLRTHYNIPEAQDIIIEEPQLSNTDRIKTENSDSSLRCHVQFNSEQRHMFANVQRYHREFLGQSLLLNLAFIRLILLQDPQSIAAVSRLSNKNKQTHVE